MNVLLPLFTGKSAVGLILTTEVSFVVDFPFKLKIRILIITSNCLSPNVDALIVFIFITFSGCFTNYWCLNDIKWYLLCKKLFHYIVLTIWMRFYQNYVAIKYLLIIICDLTSHFMHKFVEWKFCLAFSHVRWAINGW